MAFRLRQDAKKWFAEISGKQPFKVDFDIYYFCLMAGLVSGRRSEPTQGSRLAPEFVNNFTEDYLAAKTLIVGLLIIAELTHLGIDLHEKQDVRNTIHGLVDPVSQTGLTDEGMRLLNQYASGGYDYFAEKRSSKPYHAEEFLRDFVQLVGSAIDENNLWNEDGIATAAASA